MGGQSVWDRGKLWIQKGRTCSPCQECQQTPWEWNALCQQACRPLCAAWLVLRWNNMLLAMECNIPEMTCKMFYHTWPSEQHQCHWHAWKSWRHSLSLLGSTHSPALQTAEKMISMSFFAFKMSWYLTQKSWSNLFKVFRNRLLGGGHIHVAHKELSHHLKNQTDEKFQTQKEMTVKRRWNDEPQVSPRPQDLLAPHGIFWQMGQMSLKSDMMLTPNKQNHCDFFDIKYIMSSLVKSQNTSTLPTATIASPGTWSGIGFNLQHYPENLKDLLQQKIRLRTFSPLSSYLSKGLQHRTISFGQIHFSMVIPGDHWINQGDITLWTPQAASAASSSWNSI